jgi:hypothetical protein
MDQNDKERKRPLWKMIGAKLEKTTEVTLYMKSDTQWKDCRTKLETVSQKKEKYFSKSQCWAYSNCENFEC